MTESKRTLSIFAVIVAVVVLCLGTGYIGYSYSQYALKIDEQNYNYKQGRTEGEKIGVVQGYKEGYSAGIKENATGYILHDPTYQEMKTFLASDTADSKTYNKDQYICTDYTADVKNNAGKNGIRCAAVYIIYPETGHSIVAFNTTDKGLIFIEPQYDKEVKLIIGKSYSQINGFIEQSKIDDTVLRYLLTW